MIDFKPVRLEDKAAYEQHLMRDSGRGCECSFANLYLWGRQKLAFVHGQALLFSQFDRRTVYPYPVGAADKGQALDAIIADARERGIACRITGLSPQTRQELESRYPGCFRFYCDRNSYDYVYDIHDLADLKGRKYQRKRNHYNRFRTVFPYYTAQPLREEDLPRVRQMIEIWYETKLREDPHGDFHLEQEAIAKALDSYRQLEMEGLMLLDGDQLLAVTMGSRLSEDTFDVHFEKARTDVDGAYAVINCEFARYIRSKFPQIRFLNREEDMGLEGLRKAKESYLPHHMVEKCWAVHREEG